MEKLTLLLFGSEPCLPCQDLKRKIKSYLEAHEEIEFKYYELKDNLPLANKLEIYSVPTLRFYINDKLTISESGYFSLDYFLDKVNRYLKLL